MKLLRLTEPELHNILRHSVKSVLKEYHRELKLPLFDTGASHDAKTNAEAYLDWIEDFGKYGKLSASKIKFEDGIKSGLKTAAYWGKTTSEEMLKSLKGSDFYKNRKLNDKGNLYVERAIKVPDLKDKDIDDKYYAELIQKYQNNVGGCWSWKQGNAKAYCGDDNKSGNVILKGYIRLDDIDWVETDYINSEFYSIAYEAEVRVKPNAIVEVFEIQTNIKVTQNNFGQNIPQNEQKWYNLPLKEHILVHSTYFGNNKVYRGNYAPIYNAQSKNQMYMDRKGNIVSLTDYLNNKLNNGADPHDIFDNVGFFEDGFARVKLNDKWNFIDTNNSILSPDQWFDDARNFNNGFARVELDNKWGLIDAKGNIISMEEIFNKRLANAIEKINNGADPYEIFDDVDNFVDGFARVELDHKCNFIDTKGNLLSKNQWFDDAYDFKNDLAIVELDDKWNLIDTKGNLIFNQWFDYVSNFIGGFARVELNNKWNFIDTKGNIVSLTDYANIKLKNGVNPHDVFDDIRDFHDGYARVEINSEYNFIDAKGNILSKNKWFNYARDFHDGFAKVEINGEYNFINTNGNLISNQWFDYARNFNNGFAIIFLDDKGFNFIDAKGNIVSKNQWFYKVYDFHDGFAKVILNDKRYLLDIKGQLHPYND